MSHTKGPWEVDSGMVQTVAEHTCKLPGCGVHIPIAWMDREPGNGTMPVERDANAKLIAAAPDLLAALTRLADYTFETGEYLADDREDLIRVVNAAIRKAGAK